MNCQTPPPSLLVISPAVSSAPWTACRGDAPHILGHGMSSASALADLRTQLAAYAHAAHYGHWPALTAVPEGGVPIEVDAAVGASMLQTLRGGAIVGAARPHHVPAPARARSAYDPT